MGRRVGTLNKKGQIIEGIVVLIIIFVFVLLTYFGLKMTNELNSKGIQGLNSGNATSIIVKGVDTYSVFDTVFTILLLGLIIANAITLFFIRTHPLFFVITFLATGVVILFAVVISNVFDDTITNTELNNATTFDVIPSVMSNLPLFILILVIIFAIILYAKPRLGGEFT